MDIKSEALALEARAAAAGVDMAVILAEASVHRATWDRWKAGNNSPRLVAWRDVIKAIEKREAA